ncbi:MAG TPA: DUF1203 domain-containing protein [Azospirillaceae bacterium]|nr:DUF1203 domain-containing protein [Azospirillaceae bacterium]
MAYRITGLPPEPFQPLSFLPDADLAARGIKRVTADAPQGFPCRVTLEDAPVGSSLLLLSHQHQPADSPYRASGPIFVREGAEGPAVIEDRIPPYLSTRLLSVRAYDQDDLIVEAEVVDGGQVEPLFLKLLDMPAVAYLHVHFARRGCYAARVERD